MRKNLFIAAPVAISIFLAAGAEAKSDAVTTVYFDAHVFTAEYGMRYTRPKPAWDLKVCYSRNSECHAWRCCLPTPEMLLMS